MEPDWSRERPRRYWDPSRRLLRTIRRYQSAASRGNWLGRKYWALQHRFWSIVTQAEIDLQCDIGGGLLLPHPNGVVIHPDTKVGANCLIMQQVTLGTNGADGPPVVGDGVDIGPGAKILGPVTVGSGALIGACSLVLGDVPAGKVAFGIPARVRRARGEGPARALDQKVSRDSSGGER
ncbi:MAG: serine acetyltransferase [Alphaproteobacteria bacterium]|nr:serine acetyltransferase [Alphaproteobacteria bacterium]